MSSRSKPSVMRSVCGSVKLELTEKIGSPTPSPTPGWMLERLMRSTPLGVHLVPQPGASGSKHEVVPTLQLGSVGSSPAVLVLLVYCTPRRPLEEKSCAHRRAGVRLQ